MGDLLKSFLNLLFSVHVKGNFQIGYNRRSNSDLKLCEEKTR